MLDYLDSRDERKLLAMGYTIVRKLAEGSFSKVYMATYSSLNDAEKKEFPRDQPLKLAVKLIDRDRLPVDLVRYLDEEIHLLGQISHPHIIHVHSVLQRTNLYMIFMRHAEYGSLCSFLQSYGALKEKFARIWIRQLALALLYLHGLQVAHRAVKCENILVTSNNNVKLADFGFARFTATATGEPALCDTFCGSLPYAAPEVILGQSPYDGKLADIWSLGVVLYVMLNNCLPFKSESLSKLQKDQVERNFEFLEDVTSVVSPETVIVTELLLQPNPSERLPLEHLLKSSWMALEPKLLEMTVEEKLAAQHGEKLKETIHPNKEMTLEEKEVMFKEEDAAYKALVERDPCDLQEIQMLIGGGDNYYISALRNMNEFGIV